MEPKKAKDMEVGTKFVSPVRVISESDIEKYEEIRGMRPAFQRSDGIPKANCF